MWWIKLVLKDRKFPKYHDQGYRQTYIKFPKWQRLSVSHSVSTKPTPPVMNELVMSFGKSGLKIITKDNWMGKCVDIVLMFWMDTYYWKISNLMRVPLRWTSSKGRVLPVTKESFFISYNTISIYSMALIYFFIALQFCLVDLLHCFNHLT